MSYYNYTPESPEPFDDIQMLIDGGLQELHDSFRRTADNDKRPFLPTPLERVYDESKDTVTTTRLSDSTGESESFTESFSDVIARILKPLSVKILDRYVQRLTDSSTKDEAKWAYEHDTGRISSALKMLRMGSPPPGAKQLESMLQELRHEIQRRTPWLSGVGGKKQGRPLKYPQKPIVEAVEGALDRKSSWHNTGTPDQRPNVNAIFRQIDRNASDVLGDMSERTAKDRIKRALEELGEAR